MIRLAVILLIAVSSPAWASSEDVFIEYDSSRIGCDVRGRCFLTDGQVPLNGKVISRGGARSGLEEKYYVDGYLVREKKYNQQGSFNLIHDNRFNARGVWHGQRNILEANGCPREEQNYFNGQRSGPTRRYYDGCGQMVSEVNYIFNYVHGSGRTYSRQRRLIHEDIYLYGRRHGPETNMDPDGHKKVVDRHYLHGLMHGLEINYDQQSGRPRSGRTLVNGIWHGPEVSYYDNGQIKSNITYVNGVMHGPASYYDQNGLLIGEQNYINGLPGPNRGNAPPKPQ